MPSELSVGAQLDIPGGQSQMPSELSVGAQLDIPGGQSQIPAELSTGAQLNMPDGQSEVSAESLIRADQSSPDSYEARRLRWRAWRQTNFHLVISPTIILQDPEVLLRYLLVRLRTNTSYPQYNPFVESYGEEAVIQDILGAFTPQFNEFLESTAGGRYDIQQ